MRTVADALLAIEANYGVAAMQPRTVKRLLSALRTTCKHLTALFELPTDCIYLDNLDDIEARLIEYIESIGLVQQSAMQYVCNLRKLLDLAHELGGWATQKYLVRRSWTPVRVALKKYTGGSVGIVEFSISNGLTPSDLTEDFIKTWTQQMLERGRSLLTVVWAECHFRTMLRRAGLQRLFPQFPLNSKNPPEFRKQLKDLPEPLRSQILEAVRWKTADEDLDDRDAALIIRPVTAANMIRYFVELYSYAFTILGITDIVSLQQLVSEEIVCGFIDWLQIGGRCKPSSIIAKLSSIRFLALTYPSLVIADDNNYQWFHAKLSNLRKESNARVQARKLDGIPDYQSVADVVQKLLALCQTTDTLTEAEVAWCFHDCLLLMTSLAAPHRSRNIRESQVHTTNSLNIFEAEITSELLSQIKLPAWAKELRDQDPGTKFLVCHWVESETKANHEVWELFPREAVSLYHEYVNLYRPILVSKTEEHPSLFLARNGKPLTQKSLLDLVTRISVRYTGKRLTVKLFRDLVAAHMLATGANFEDVATCLWHLDPYSTTVRYYVSGFNASYGVGALEDELDTLQLQQ
jgi:hypothetical protein